MSQKAIGIAIIAICLLALTIVFYPKNVGGPLCGPVCLSTGLHYYERDCIGIKVRDTSMTDSYTDTCYGLAVGKRRCYGKAYSEYLATVEDHLMNCDYPCGDETLLRKCSEVGFTNLNFSGFTLDCYRMRESCYPIVPLDNPA
jgi:hypothetical protein